ncbi:hypothetical protein ACWQEN_001647 [Morganella morganii]|uniref:hypothetical protein n=1 Tax=Morganella TaxID=581 RepID=UPI001419665B|nr:hypothetical protein [Morganella morganii]EKU5841403.1 hypothetical protein [Morganella morganii]NIH19808.1 hypothetical protein [Morganella morganii]QXO72126.1 hypothetical protein JC793_15175 [Morganella morganii]UFH69280.1 hypothetical protein KQH80_04375 [Morganella morganii]WNP29857.1 hypothetical protein RN616_15240 [Morganella morganii]
MKELSIQEIEAVSGAGFIKDSLTSVGGKVGDATFRAFVSFVNVKVPLLAQMNIGQKYPDLGKNLGSQIGGKVGGTIETGLTLLPGVGGLFKKILG